MITITDGIFLFCLIFRYWKLKELSDFILRLGCMDIGISSLIYEMYSEVFELTTTFLILMSYVLFINFTYNKN